jgi:hypothetical protein
MTLDTDDVTIEMDLTVERGVGYLGAERSEQLPIGVIAVDAIFTPVRKVNYWVESMRVGQMTNYDKLTIEIETDGTIGPEEALSRSAEILVNQFRPFVTVGMAAAPVAPVTGAAALPANMLDMPIEELDLPMRAYNSLKRNNIVKVGQLLQLKDEDLLRMRNFGKKSLDEMKERLRMRGFMTLMPPTASPSTSIARMHGGSCCRQRPMNRSASGCPWPGSTCSARSASLPRPRGRAGSRRCRRGGRGRSGPQPTESSQQVPRALYRPSILKYFYYVGWRAGSIREYRGTAAAREPGPRIPGTGGRDASVPGTTARAHGG